MVTQAKLTIKGIDEYIEALQQAEKDIDVAAQRALMKGAEILQNEMLKRVPIKSGNLYLHIQIKGPLREGNYNYVEVGVIHDINYTDKETAIYGNVQEYGSPSKNIAARPYIRPAIDYKRAAAMRAIRESLKAEGLAE